MAAVQMFV